MLTPRALVVALAALTVLWLRFDSGYVSDEPASNGLYVALAILASVFAVSAVVMQAGGQTQRVPLIFGLALGIGTYLLMQAVTP
jgi:hypothetical protein